MKILINSMTDRIADVAKNWLVSTTSSEVGKSSMWVSRYCALIGRYASSLMPWRHSLYGIRLASKHEKNLLQPNNYPWVVMLETKRFEEGEGGIGKLRSFLCGGTLVASKYIITAAHCVFSMTLMKKIEPSAVKVWISNISDRNKMSGS